MRKYFEAGLIAFICCIALGIVLDISKSPNLSGGEAPSSISSSAPTQPKVLTPVVPKLKLASNLPQLTPEETRPPELSEASFQTIDFSDLNDANWESDWDNFGYISPKDNQYRIEIDPSNYGDRQAKDANGKPAQNEILVVLHETTSSAESAIHTFLTHHPNDANQVSYHSLILTDGRIVHLVPPEKRAYGAGNSEFRSEQGIESVQTNLKYPASVNNFAYHISLETPVEAHNKNVESHSGYSVEQYESLAWLIQELEVSPNRVTTHKAVDRAYERSDPRSFDMEYLASFLY